MNTFLDTLAFAANAVFPILGLILLGYYAKEKGLLPESALKPFNRFNFRFGISSLMYINLYNIGSLKEIPLSFAGYSVLLMFSLTLVGFLSAFVITKENSRRGVLVQAAFRSNYAIIGIPLAGALAGTAGAAIASAVQAPSIIYYNFTSVLALSYFSEAADGFQFKKVAKSIATNPLIFALVAGLITHGIRILIPVETDGTLVFTLKDNLPWLYKIINYLGSMSTPLALVILGAQFNFTAIGERKKEVIWGVTERILIAPVLGFTLAFIGRALGIITLDTANMACLIALFGSPMAVSSVVMTGEMGGDDILAGQIVVWTSLISMFSIFVTVVLFRSLGMI